MANKGKFIKIILPVCILLAGFLTMRGLIMKRQTPKKVERVNLGALVQIIEVKKTNRQVEVLGTGEVEATEEVTVTMQVSGQVSKIAAGFVAGGFFRAGDLLFAVEKIDYELAIQRVQATLAKAENSMAVAEGKAKVARQEWKNIHPNNDVPPQPLAMHEPQLKEAKANLAATEAALKQAKLDLSRTRIIAPFNCRVLSEQIGPGQYVRSGSNVAVLTAIDAAEIVVPLPMAELHWLNIPVQPNDANGSPTAVQLNFDGITHRWEGRVARSLGEVDPKDRMVRVVITVENPYRSLFNDGTTIPDLVPGTFVDVIIQGKSIPHIAVLPTSALRDHSTVWIMDDNHKLRIRTIQNIRLGKDSFWVDQGLEDGDLVITTALPGGADGMKLRPLNLEGNR